VERRRKGSKEKGEVKVEGREKRSEEKGVR
jgi:hypothetical protein